MYTQEYIRVKNHIVVNILGVVRRSVILVVLPDTDERIRGKGPISARIRDAKRRSLAGRR